MAKFLPRRASFWEKVEGNVAVSGTLHLHSSASILGDITTKFLIVDEGAKYNGACKVGN